MYCRACDEMMLPVGSAKFCDKCGHKVGNPVPEKYRFDPSGEAFGGWMRVLFGAEIVSIFAGLFIWFSLLGRVGLELFTDAMVVALLSYSVVAMVAAMAFIILLYNGKREAYAAFLFLIFLSVVWLVWSLFIDSSSIVGILLRAAWIIAWLIYFNQSERVLEHFGTNFPTKQQEEAIARLLKRQTTDKPPQEISETLEDQVKHTEEKQVKSAKQQKVKRISIAIASILAVIAVVLATIEIAQNVEEARRLHYTPRQLLYTDIMDFNFRIVVDGERRVAENPFDSDYLFALNRFDPRSSYFDPDAMVVFVYTEEEALELPDNVIAAWPSTQTLRGINALNWNLQNGDWELIGEGSAADLSLDFPITIVDVVENWKEVVRLRNLGFWQEESLMQGNSPEFIAKMEQLIWERRSESVPQTVISASDIYLMSDFGFEFRMVTEYGVMSDPVAVLMRTQALHSEFFDSSYSDLVLVDSEEEALSYPDNIITVWPTQETNTRINALNWIIHRQEINYLNSLGVDEEEILFIDSRIALSHYVPDTPLFYPLTIADLLESREDFSELWHVFQVALDWRAIEGIFYPRTTSRHEGNAPEFLEKLERLKEKPLPDSATEEVLISEEDMRFFLDFGFEFSASAQGEAAFDPAVMPMYTQPRYLDLFNPYYTDFVFVGTKEELSTLSKGTIAAWPTHETHEQIMALNWVLFGNRFYTGSIATPTAGEDLNPKDFSFELPVTIADMVYNSEAFVEMWDALEEQTKSMVRTPLSDGRLRANSPEFFAEMEDLFRRASYENLPEALIPARDIYLVSDLALNFRMIVGGEMITEPGSIIMRTQAFYPDTFNSYYTDLVFVRTEEEALQLPDNVIAVWPSRETRRRMNTLNETFYSPVWPCMWVGGSRYQERINLEDFSLERPVDIADLIENTENFMKMWDNLANYTRLEIRDPNSQTSRWANIGEL